MRVKRAAGSIREEDSALLFIDGSDSSYKHFLACLA